MKTFQDKIKEMVNNRNGFVALFAVLLSMLILAMALGISNISLKEAQLSILAKEGHIALFSADSGVECALYGDLEMFGFGDSLNEPEASSTFDCAGANTDGSVGKLDFNFDGDFTYDFNLYVSDSQCARVFIDKDYPVTTDSLSTVSYTKIDSYGYNVSCSQVSKNNNPKKVERAERVMYPN